MTFMGNGTWNKGVSVYVGGDGRSNLSGAETGGTYRAANAVAMKTNDFIFLLVQRTTSGMSDCWLEFVEKEWVWLSQGQDSNVHEDVVALCRHGHPTTDGAG